jgi:hypothetical protein
MYLMTLSYRNVTSVNWSEGAVVSFGSMEVTTANVKGLEYVYMKWPVTLFTQGGSYFTVANLGAGNVGVSPFLENAPSGTVGYFWTIRKV